MQPEQGDVGSLQLSELSRTMRAGLFRLARHRAHPRFYRWAFLTEVYCDWLCHWLGRPTCSTFTATVSVSLPPP
jgi:hypothetical protein